MFLRLLNGAEESEFILLLPTVGVSVSDLLASFTVNQDVSLVTLEQEEQEVAQQLREGGAGEVTVIQLGDILGWDSPLDPNLPKTVLEQVKKGSTVVLDCLTELLVLLDELLVARLLSGLKKLATSKARLVAVLHSDCVAAELVASVEQSATTCLRLEREGEGRLLTVRHRKPGGKVVVSREVLTRGQGGKLQVRDYKKEEKKVFEEEEDAEATIGKLTTFSLSTNKEAEQVAKEKLVLPFYTEEQKKVVGLQEQEPQVVIQGENKGAIFYEPDSGDDWDDEDPDDDLDF